MSGGELGVVELGETLVAPFAVSAGDDVPAEPTSLPTYRVYGQGTAPVTNGLGSASKLDTGTVTNASNATPIVITQASHGLQTGTSVTVSGVTGNTAANGTFSVIRVTADTYSLTGSSGNGAYASGGVAHVTGLYRLSIAVTAGDGYEAGKTYHVHVTWTIASVQYAALFSFRVI